ncbi:gamma-glutamylcyclotransferase [Mesorhizobium australicum]|uniref:glutathione-specific gamma-glutamylcyclotransferase n=1 Tax=Mesorhizobium australicum TaxID=536018 RepID=A0A1X7PTT7_9HYPH|nr:gamma-glutamylcyclotransferase [Mesorhizobium australicum]SMH54859.1 cation transport protein ChaC [Mesorhizobium australicum]
MDGNAKRQMRLSREHVAKATRKMPDPGIHLLPGFVPATDADYDRVVAEIIAGAPNDGFWVFAYGSLIWNPDFDFTEQRNAVARGWRRRFCLGWDYRWRGNREQPGLMLALDRGGQCNGVIFRLPDAAIEANMHRLIRREMSMVPSAFPPRWIRVETPDGPLKALTFAMNRNSGRYIGSLDDEAIADVLATACGFRGSMAEYLHATVSHLDMLGIRDRHLWRLQEMVAERLDRAEPVSS